MAARSNFRVVKQMSVPGTQLRPFTTELTARQKELQRVCRNFAKIELAPAASQVDRDARFPYLHIKKLSEMGLIRACVSKECGGSEYDLLSLAIAIEEISRGCASTGFVLCINNALFANLVQQRGSEEQKQEFLTTAPADSVGGFALSEAEAGSDAAGIQTKVTEDGDHYVLNGTKSWVTSAIEGRALAVFGTVDPKLRHQGLACFLVPTDTPGVFRGKKLHTLGVKAASVCDMQLAEVRVPRRYLVGEIGEGFRIAMAQLDQARVGIAAKAVGIAQAALDLALKHSKERTAFGRPLLRHHAVQDRLADMSILTETARLLTYRACTQLSTKNSAMAKYVASRNATVVTDHAVQILGGKGLATDSDAERHYRDARGTQIYGGVTDVQKRLVGFHLIKETVGPFWRPKD